MEARELFDDICFRGRDAQTGGWHYGLPHTTINARGFSEVFICTRNYQCFSIDPATLGQWTGGKDSAGMRIYEGDTVMDSLGALYTVRYIADTMQFELVDEDGFKCVLWNGMKHKVVGNVYDGAENGTSAKSATAQPEDGAQRPVPDADAADAPSGDAVNHPSHYNTGYVEVIDAIEAWGFGSGFNRGNVIKYVARAGHKGGASELEDLKKALFYLQREITRCSQSEQI